jgi:DNA polymerase-3 subunit epsilon
MIKKIKTLFCDVETTGLDPSRHAVIQLAGLIDIDGEVVEEFDFKLQPFPGQLLSQESLDINRVTKEEMKTFLQPMAAYIEITKLFNKYVSRFDKSDKFFLVGYNSTFDDSFLRAFFKNCGDEYYGSYIWWPTIDIAPFAVEFFKEERSKFPDFKLSTVCKAFGIEVDDTETHNALYDSKLTRKVYRKIILGE